MAWNDLSIAQKSQMMNFFRQRGVSSLSEMKQLYDSAYPSSGQSDWGGNVPPVFDKGGQEEFYSSIAPSKIAASLPSIDTKEGKRIAKNMAGRIVSGKMTISEVPRKYQAYVNGEIKGAKPVTQATSRAGEKLLPYAIGAAFGPAGIISTMAGEAVDMGVNATTKGEKNTWGDLLANPEKHPVWNTVAQFTNPGYLLAGPLESGLKHVAADPGVAMLKGEGKKYFEEAAKAWERQISKTPASSIRTGINSEVKSIPAEMSKVAGWQGDNNLFDVYNKKFLPAETKANLLDDVLDDAFMRVQAEPSEIPYEDILGYDALNVKDLAEVQSTREWLKDFNRTFTRRHGYDPIPLKLSENPEAAEQAVKDLLHRHNRVVRGVSDFRSRDNRLTRDEKAFSYRMMSHKGFNPDSREDRLVYAATRYAPEFKHYGRADSPEPYLSRVKGEQLSYLNPYSNDFEYFNPFEGEDLFSVGTHYASNSIGTGQGYTYGDGKIALLEYPFKLGEDRTLWKYEADFPVEVPYEGRGFGSQIAERALKYSGDYPKYEPVPLDKPMWYSDVRPSEMTVDDIYNLINDTRIHRDLSRDTFLSNLVTDYRYMPNGTYYQMPSPIAFPDEFMFYANKLGYTKDPKNLGELINNRAILRAFKEWGPRSKAAYFRKGNLAEIGKLYRKEKDSLWKAAKSTGNREKALSNLRSKIDNAIIDVQGTPTYEFMKSITPEGRYLNSGKHNAKKSDTAFSHFISTGHVGDEAAKFIDWIDSNMLDQDQVGTITRQHYGTGANFLTRNVKAEGGKIHIKKSKRGTFTAAAKKRGMSVQAFARKVLANPDEYSPAMRKKANFARNASKWKAEGGELGLLPILETALDNM